MNSLGFNKAEKDTKIIVAMSGGVDSSVAAVKLKKEGVSNCRIEGKNSDDWKLVDGIDIIIHIFNPEKRKFYNLEKMWSELLPKERLTI